MLHRLRVRGNMLHFRYSGYANDESPFLDPHYGEIYYEMMPLQSTPSCTLTVMLKHAFCFSIFSVLVLLISLIYQLSIRIQVLKQCVYNELIKAYGM